MPRGNPNLHLNNAPWPEERTERLKRLFAAGQTDQQIAQELGVSVRSVMGKRRRLKLLRVSHAGDPLEMALGRARRGKG